MLGACDQTLAYSLGTISSEPFDRPAHVPAPVVYIDGVARSSLQIEYASVDDALPESHVLELRYGDQVVRSREVVLREESCLRDGPSRYSQTFCVYESGDFRFSSDGSDHCVGDALCLPPCHPFRQPTGCAGATRCTSLVGSMEPFASHLGCAPIGPKTFGDACSVIAGEPLASYDDCGNGLLCVEGTCHLLCEGPSPGCPSCDYVPGHAPELRVCRM